MGVQKQEAGRGSGKRGSPEADDTFCENVIYFEPVLKYMHDYTNHFNYEMEQKSIWRQISGRASKNAMASHWA